MSDNNLSLLVQSLIEKGLFDHEIRRGFGDKLGHDLIDEIVEEHFWAKNYATGIYLNPSATTIECKKDATTDVLASVDRPHYRLNVNSRYKPEVKKEDDRYFIYFKKLEE